MYHCWNKAKSNMLSEFMELFKDNVKSSYIWKIISKPSPYLGVGLNLRGSCHVTSNHIFHQSIYSASLRKIRSWSLLSLTHSQNGLFSKEILAGKIYTRLIWSASLVADSVKRLIIHAVEPKHKFTNKTLKYSTSREREKWTYRITVAFVVGLL